MDSRVYRYGVLAIAPESKQQLYAELKAMGSFRNRLVHIERLRRSRQRRVLRIANPKLEELRLQYEGLSSQCRVLLETKMAGIRKKDRPSELTAELQDLEIRKKSLLSELRAVREQTLTEHFSLVFDTTQEYLKVIVANGKLPEAVLKAHEDLTNDDIRALEAAADYIPDEGLRLETPEGFRAYRQSAVNPRPKKGEPFSKALLGPSSHDRKKAKALGQEKTLAKANRFARLWSKINEHAERRSKVVKEKSSLGPGNSGLVVAAAQASFQKSSFEPKFVPYDGRGQVGNQLQKRKGEYLTVEQAHEGKDSRLSIQKIPLDPAGIFLLNDPEQKRPWFLRKPNRYTGGTRRRFGIEKGAYVKQVARVSLQVKKGCILRFDVLLHRPMPEGAQIRYAYLTVNRIGTYPKYYLDLTLSSETFSKPPVGPNVPTVAINVGWSRQADGSVRVATLYDGKDCQHVLLPEKIMSGMERKEHLLQLCDNIFNGEKEFFRKWLQEHDLSPELRQALETTHCLGRDYQPENYTDKEFKTYLLRSVSTWRSHKKLGQVAFVLAKAFLAPDEVYRWNRHRLKPEGMTWKKWRASLKGEDPQDLFPTAPRVLNEKALHSTLDLQAWKPSATPVELLALHLALWSQKDRHLVNWARHLETSIRLWRQEIYRRVANHLYREFGRVIIEDWDKSQTARKRSVAKGGNTPQEERAQHLRQTVGVYKLIMSLKDKFGKHNVVVEDPKGISVSHDCGGTAKRDQSKSNTMLQCEACKRLFDQDEQAARNLYRRYFERVPAAAE